MSFTDINNFYRPLSMRDITLLPFAVSVRGGGPMVRGNSIETAWL